MMNITRELPITSWTERVSEEQSQRLTKDLENGCVLVLPNLAFDLADEEKQFLSIDWSDGKAKNISLQPKENKLIFKGAKGDAVQLEKLQAMIQRYSNNAQTLVNNLFQPYRHGLKTANTSFRPFQVEGRMTSYRKDDTRLHVDAFPSNPTRGTRLLRVFNNVNPNGLPRVWRVGESFEDMIEKFLPKTKNMFPFQDLLMYWFKATKKVRSEYDHRMLQLHDLVKADLDYQRNSPQKELGLMPGTTWIVYSDQVQHAVMSGQFMFEQTFHLPNNALIYPEQSPLAILEKKLGKKLV